MHTDPRLQEVWLYDSTGNPMTAPCRFEWRDHGKNHICVTHGTTDTAACDLGLAALRAELKKQKQECLRLSIELLKSVNERNDQARVMGRLREALQPFAALLHPHHKSQEGTYPVFGINEEKITVADLRRANEALSPEKAA